MAEQKDKGSREKWPTPQFPEAGQWLSLGAPGKLSTVLGREVLCYGGLILLRRAH